MVRRSNESLSRVDSSVHLIYHDPIDLGSLILIRIISKERTLSLSKNENMYKEKLNYTKKTKAKRPKRKKKKFPPAGVGPQTIDV